MSDLSIKTNSTSDSLKFSVNTDKKAVTVSTETKATSFSNDTVISSKPSLNPIFKNFSELNNVSEGKSELKTGDKGKSVTAIQRGLLTLGYNEIKQIDASFGEKGTKLAVEHFQKDQGLNVTGKLDKDTLISLSKALDKQMSKPFNFLPSMTPINLKEKSWNSQAVKDAYGQFVKERWEYLKNDVIETDCKGLALKLMYDFRDYYKEQTGITIPFPGSKSGVKEAKQESSNASNPKGWAGAPLDKSLRSDYDSFKKIKEAYPEESIIRGTNYRFGGISADQAARKMTDTIESRDNGKPIVQPHSAKLSADDKKVTPEVDINQLKPGDMIFIDHTDNGKSWDHTVNIIDVNKRDDGTVESLKIGVAAFDDLNDQNSKTLPKFPNINFYAEEVIVKFNDKGKATSSDVTWTSEPNYVHPARYSVTSTLMETRAGGKLKVGRWTD